MAKGTLLCSIEGCGKPVQARGWCNTHYARWRRQGDPHTVLGNGRPDPLCTLDKCDNPHYARGWCRKHYQRWRNHGDPHWDPGVKQPRACSEDDCDREHYGRGLCRAHYMTHRASPSTPVEEGGRSCSLDGCGRVHYAKGYCHRHWYKWKQHGDPGPAQFREYVPGGALCTGPACSRPAKAKKLCTTHYKQMVAGRPLSVIRDSTRHNADGLKQCSRCDRWLPLEEFHASTKSSDGRRSRCIRCVRNTHLFVKYGINLDFYEHLLEEQGGVCAICGQVDPKGALHVDHDHACCPRGGERGDRTGSVSCGRCVRGLVCGPCNKALGMFKDDPSVLQAAVAYLRKHGK